ncbi:hypothetical protein MSC49_40060 (plasmid) [Methylosinus sp. C49]|uniref:hypothetical protein n=1 Tax=Methylosinus sp. C49 TaxID=2699395 RepID=UPI0013672881|nr:hypothetical protein [Methylosinus sp. C49]BBU64071.1 hypothetical protein MSC49_40060 [Methylosinus sp. C49]
MHPAKDASRARSVNVKVDCGAIIAYFPDDAIVGWLSWHRNPVAVWTSGQDGGQDAYRALPRCVYWEHARMKVGATLYYVASIVVEADDAMARMSTGRHFYSSEPRRCYARCYCG